MQYRIRLSALVLAAAFSAFLASSLAADEGNHGRSSRLSGGEDSEARGRVVLNPAILHVIVQGLAAGDYKVQLDDGTGTKADIGTITIAPNDDEDDDGDDGEDGDDEGDGGGVAEEDHSGAAGHLILAGEDLPFGATSPTDLGGRAICVVDAAGNVVLSGTTPNKIPNDEHPRVAHCPLSRPDPAVDEDAEGSIKLESGGGRAVIKVQLENLEPGKVYDVSLTNPAGDTTESIGTVTTDEEGEGQLKIDSAKGDSLPFGVGDVAELVGYSVAVKDEAGAVVLVGTVCEPQTRPDNEHPEPGKRCFTASLDGAQEVPPVDTTATGTATFELGGPDALTLHYEITVEGLSGPATAAHIHAAPVGVPGDVIVPLDATTLSGEVEITPEIRDAIRSGDTYVNVHTEAHPDGEIRGQLTPCQDDDEDDDDDDDDDDHEDNRCFTASLDGAQEVPPVDTTATGTATFELGGPDALTLHYEITVEGLSGPATAAHIHAAPVGVPGDVIVPLDAATLAGDVDITPENRDAIRSGDTYVNVHTEAHPDGEIRGQLTPCPDDDEDDDDDEHEGDDEEEGEGGGIAVLDDTLFVLSGKFDTPFLRGDANNDAAVDVADSIFSLNYLFRGGVAPLCLDAVDVNDDGRVDISDPISELTYLFLGGVAPASPGVEIPSTDATADGLFCEEQP